MKKTLICLLAILVLACSAASANGGSEAAAPAAEKKTYTVGICQLVQHVALDAATDGFRDAIIEALGKDNVTFSYNNASGDSATVATIINNLVSANVDLILANATPPLQAAASATEKIPILGTSITDYASALGMPLNASGATGINVSGASDLAPLDGQAAMIKELFHEAKNVGLLYCSAEANSIYQITEMEKHLDALGIGHTRFAFTDSNDVSSVTQSACSSCDVLYIPTDNTAASCTEAIRNVVEPAKKPVVAGEEGICAGCGVATLTISYYDLGVTTGKMAVQVLQGADVSKMPIEYAANPIKKYNKELCEIMGVKVPSDYTAI
ncbi:MAG: ABC transporter substrate-binding protein [Spirochaetales bacterium]|nr:ABC transporter substrate-binding protein [Spirochaetales bacterium]